MRRLSQLARGWALVALTLFSASAPARSDEPQAETRAVGPSEPRPSGVRGRPTERRAPALRNAPPGFDGWARQLRPVDRRALSRQLRRMPAQRQDEFFRRWERMSVSERRELSETLALRSERRRSRELPPRLATPEMRERFEQMSPQERERFFARVRDWRDMQPSERHRMRARLAKFGALPDSEQNALVENKFARKSPEERAKILRDLREASQQMQARGAAPGDE